MNETDKKAGLFSLYLMLFIVVCFFFGHRKDRNERIAVAGVLLGVYGVGLLLLPRKEKP